MDFIFYQSEAFNSIKKKSYSYCRLYKIPHRPYTINILLSWGKDLQDTLLALIPPALSGINFGAVALKGPALTVFL